MTDRARFDYDVALSFAGEDRDFAEAVAKNLLERGVRVFYDRYVQADLWGSDLYVHLDNVYRKRARYCLMFLSRHYAAKVWTSHERKAAQARAMTESNEYLLPVRLDDCEIPGLLPTLGYIQAADFGANAIASLVAQKLRRESLVEAAANTVGLFVDFEYLWHGLERMERIPITRMGHALVAYARNFGDPRSLWASVESAAPGRAAVADHLARSGFSITTPTKRGSADFALLERITEETIRGRLQTFLLVTGDGDFFDKVMSLLLLGHAVRLVARSSSLFARYRSLAEERQRVRQAAGFQEGDFAIDDLDQVLSNQL